MAKKIPNLIVLAGFMVAACMTASAVIEDYDDVAFQRGEDTLSAIEDVAFKTGGWEVLGRTAVFYSTDCDMCMDYTYVDGQPAQIHLKGGHVEFIRKGSYVLRADNYHHPEHEGLDLFCFVPDVKRSFYSGVEDHTKYSTSKVSCSFAETIISKGSYLVEEYILDGVIYADYKEYSRATNVNSAVGALKKMDLIADKVGEND